MELPTSFTDLLLELAGGKNKRPKLAIALGRTYWEITYWARINDIPTEHWEDIIALAAERKLEGVNWEYLKRLKKEKEMLCND